MIPRSRVAALPQKRRCQGCIHASACVVLCCALHSFCRRTAISMELIWNITEKIRSTPITHPHVLSSTVTAHLKTRSFMQLPRPVFRIFARRPSPIQYRDALRTLHAPCVGSCISNRLALSTSAPPADGPAPHEPPKPVSPESILLYEKKSKVRRHHS